MYIKSAETLTRDKISPKETLQKVKVALINSAFYLLKEKLCSLKSE